MSISDVQISACVRSNHANVTLSRTHIVYIFQRLNTKNMSKKFTQQKSSTKITLISEPCVWPAFCLNTLRYVNVSV